MFQIALEKYMLRVSPKLRAKRLFTPSILRILQGEKINKITKPRNIIFFSLTTVLQKLINLQHI